MSQLKSLVTVSPLGLMYGSAGGFLSPENLVGRSNTKFPPDAATMAGLLLNANREQNFADPQHLKRELVVAGPFWAKRDDTPRDFYVPIPWHRVVGRDECGKLVLDEWFLAKKAGASPLPDQSPEPGDSEWHLNQYQWQRRENSIKPAYSWQLVSAWNEHSSQLQEPGVVANAPWRATPLLHPQLKPDERHVVAQDGLFLENAVQLPEEDCLVYLTNVEHGQFNGWYRFGGEGHLVEIESHPLSPNHRINRLLNQKIGHTFALITPGVWGSNKLSYRYPQHPSFPKRDLKLLTDKAVPFRYRIGRSHNRNGVDANNSYDPESTGRLSRGRYAVPAGSVYVLREPLGMTWWDFPQEWFPKEGFPLKHLGCGLSLPVDIQGVPKCTEKLTASSKP